MRRAGIGPIGDALRSVIQEIGDKGPLAAALCTANSKLPVKATGGSVELCVREVGHDLFILACSREPRQTTEVQFSALTLIRGRRRGAVRSITQSDGEGWDIQRSICAV